MWPFKSKTEEVVRASLEFYREFVIRNVPDATLYSADFDFIKIKGTYRNAINYPFPSGDDYTEAWMNAYHFLLADNPKYLKSQESSLSAG